VSWLILGTLLFTIRKLEGGASNARHRTIAVHVRTGNGLLTSGREPRQGVSTPEATALIAAAWQWG
jgi:hypothetical protein